MRVTNEQIDAVLICHKQMQCSECKYDKTLDDCQPTQEQFAADLLEARELINEMREVIEAYAHGMKYDMNAIRVKSDALLEKTKEYAE